MLNCSEPESSESSTSVSADENSTSLTREEVGKMKERNECTDSVKIIRVMEAKDTADFKTKFSMLTLMI